MKICVPTDSLLVLYFYVWANLFLPYWNESEPLSVFASASLCGDFMKFYGALLRYSSYDTPF